MGIAKQKKLRGATESYGNENYYLWVHKQCAKHTISRGGGGSITYPHRKILSAIRLNLEAIFGQ